MARAKQQKPDVEQLVQGPGGRIRMDFVEFSDDGNIPDTHISGMARIERISPGMVRITEYVEHSYSDGSIDRRVITHRVMDVQVWTDMQLQAAEVMRIIKSSPMSVPSNGNGKRRDAN